VRGGHNWELIWIIIDLSWLEYRVISQDISRRVTIMNLLFYFILAAIVVYTYTVIYRRYHTYPEAEILTISETEVIPNLQTNRPFLVARDLGIKEVVSIDILHRQYGNRNIRVRENFRLLLPSNPPSMKKMRVDEFINDYIYAQDNRYYFKTEDDYNFLGEIGLYQTVIDKFSSYKPSLAFQSLSLWLGGKGTCTPFHYDSDCVNILYLIEGAKKLYMIHPKYDHKMRGNRLIQSGASWSMAEIETILQDREIEYSETLLKPGQMFNIPRFWWHAVINLEATFAVTYHYYTLSYFIC
jgi:hypothetical protein